MVRIAQHSTGTAQDGTARHSTAHVLIDAEFAHSPSPGHAAPARGLVSGDRDCRSSSCRGLGTGIWRTLASCPDPCLCEYASFHTHVSGPQCGVGLISLIIAAHMGKVIACTRARAGMTLMGRPPGPGPCSAQGCQWAAQARAEAPPSGPRGPPEPSAGAWSELHPGRRLHCQRVAGPGRLGLSEDDLVNSASIHVRWKRRRNGESILQCSESRVHLGHLTEFFEGEASFDASRCN